jgi:Carboxypeptidase regulatory-like domain
LFMLRALESYCPIRFRSRLRSQVFRFGKFSFLFFLTLFAARPSFSQEENTRGKVAGIVRDQDGSPVVGANIQVFSQVHDTHYELTTDDKGHYESTWLYEGQYAMRIEARNFKVDQFLIDVKIGQTANGDRTLTPINPGSPVVLSHVDPERTGYWPIDGRDPLNAAKYEPEILPEDAGRLDPSKAGSFTLSIDKLSGLDARYTLDGVDMNDETHGSLTQNVAMSSVRELTVTQAFRDVSTGLSSSGAVLMTTRSGSEGLHGEGFGFFRNSPIGFAAEPGGQDPNYSRQDFGGRLGGGLLQNKLFFFLDAELVHENLKQAVVAPFPFQSLTSQYSAPFRNTSASGRLDWNFSENAHAFYRFSYNINSTIDNFGQGYGLYDSKTHSPSHAFGLDYTKGDDVHSIRFGYFTYNNSVQGATTSPLIFPNLPVGLRFTDVADGALQFGPSPYAPQQTLQRNIEFRYDRTRNHPIHPLRYGASITRITAGGYANRYGLGPQMTTVLGNGLDPNPGDYPVLGATLSNGQQYSTETSGFGFPHGGQSDYRLQGYVTGAYRLYPNLTITWGTHYVYDSGLTNSDLAEIPCSAIVASLPSSTLPCNAQSRLMDAFNPAFGGPVTRPLTNFGPQVGFAWDPYRNGRTVIRGGAGAFFDTSLFSNVGLDRSVRLSQGAYAATNVLACPGGTPGPGTATVYFPAASGLSQAVTSINGRDLATQVCGQPASVAAPYVAALQSQYQQAVAGIGANPYFVGRTLGISNAVNGLSAFQSDYHTPRSYQMNIGIQRQAWRGGVASADYVRNVSERFGLIEDENHVGDELYLNNNAALNALTRTIAERAPACLPGVPLTAGAISQNAVSCYIAAVPGASINDFAANGLDSGTAYLAGQAASIARGVGPNLGAAFSGINPLVGSGSVQASVGHAIYDGFQGSLRQDLSIPYFAFKAESFQLTYTLSKFLTSGGDNPSQSYPANDFRDGALYRGPSPLDRRHQISFAGTLDTRWGPRILFSGRIASPAPSVLTLAAPSGNPQTSPGEIFRTDFTGDGTPGDIFPPRLSSAPFSPPAGADNIYTAISRYDASQAGTLTPAGQQLVTQKILLSSQLSVLHATTPYVALPPLDQVSNPWYKGFDTAVTWPLHWRESILIEPRISFFNIFNFSNFAPLGGQLSYYFPGLSLPISGGVGSANGTPSGSSRDVLRTGYGTGVYNAGAPRQMEFGVKITF